MRSDSCISLLAEILPITPNLPPKYLYSLETQSAPLTDATIGILYSSSISCNKSIAWPNRTPLPTISNGFLL